MPAKITQWSTKKRPAAVERFLRRPAFDPKAESAAAAVLADIRERGEKALLDAIAKFDRAPLSAKELRVTEAEIAAAESRSRPPSSAPSARHTPA